MTRQQHMGKQSRAPSWPDGKVLNNICINKLSTLFGIPESNRQLKYNHSLHYFYKLQSSHYYCPLFQPENVRTKNLYMPYCSVISMVIMTNLIDFQEDQNWLKQVEQQIILELTWM